jgi:NIMA (never in mitosis gene a)-related kinase
MAEFKVLKILGQGQGGEVYLAHKIGRPDQLYAVKDVSFEHLSTDERDAALREVKALLLLKHDNIIRMYDAKITHKHLTILMEYADGGSLDSLIKSQKKALPENRVLDLFVQICLAVKYIHDRKIIHRDLKPRNIFLSGKGIVKLGDFGSVRGLDATEGKASTLVGTPFFLSPEICRCETYSKPSDIWALGCVLYELCALQHAFNGENMMALVREILSGRIPKLPSIYSRELRELYRSIMQRDPEARPSIHEILNVPLLKFKVIALLGPDRALQAMKQEAFHGLPPGEAPPEENEIVKLKTGEGNETENFVFMGRVLETPKNCSKTQRIAFVENFMLNLVTRHRLDELREQILSRSDANVSRTEEPVIELLWQLIRYERNGN